MKKILIKFSRVVQVSRLLIVPIALQGMQQYSRTANKY